MRCLKLDTCAFDLLLDVGRALDSRFFRLPDLLQFAVLCFHLGDLLVQLIQACQRGFVGLFLQCLAFHLSLDQATFELVHLFGRTIDLHADHRGRLVDQVDRLVGQLPVRDVTVRQRRGADNRRVGDVHAVVHLVTLLEPAQDGDGVFHRRFLDQDLLETALKGGILFDILAVFIQRGGADTVQFAARQRRLEHVARVHGPLGLARADHGVNLVDEQDDRPLCLGNVVEHRFQALLEITTVLGAGEQGAQVQRQQALVADAFRYLVVDDALRQALGDGGFTHAGLADQHRVVLGAPLQDLDGATDLVVTTDDRVDLALFGALGQVDGVLFQRIALLFGVGICDRLPAAHLVDRLADHVAGQPQVFQGFAQLALVFERGQQEQFGSDVVIAFFLCVLVHQVEQFAQFVGDVYFTWRTFHLGQGVDHLVQRRAQLGNHRTGLGQQGAYRAALLVQHRQHQMCWFNELVVASYSQALRVLQRQLKF